MKDPQKLKELILEKVSLADVMVSYGVEFIYNPTRVSEVQLKCPFHGRDTKPSARLYNSTNSFFCWVCRKSWDVVGFIMDKENFSYRHALNYLINRYKVDISSIPDKPTLELKTIAIKTQGDITTDYFEDNKKVLLKKVHENLLAVRKIVPFDKYRALCGIYCHVRYKDHCGEDVLELLKKIEDKIKWVTES
jgi:DNA primase